MISLVIQADPFDTCSQESYPLFIMQHTRSVNLLKKRITISRFVTKVQTKLVSSICSVVINAPDFATVDTQTPLGNADSKESGKYTISHERQAYIESDPSSDFEILTFQGRKVPY